MGQPIRILVVDDHPAVRDVLCKLLQRIPRIEVVGCARDGREAVDLALLHEPDIVLMDIQMPRMDGLEAAQQIKHHQPHIKVILTSAIPTYRAEALRAGADMFVPKEPSLSCLQAAVLGVGGHTSQA